MSDLITIHLAVRPAAPDAWLWALGTETIRYRRTDLHITRDVLASLAQSCDGWEPPIYDDHDPDGPVLGHVIGARIMSRDEARAEGIEQEHDHALYLSARWTPEGRRRDEAGEVHYSSVGMRSDYEDHTGTVHPWALAELSITHDPVIKRGQIPRPHLAGVTLSEEGTMEHEDGGTTPDVQSLMDQVAALSETVAALAERVNAMVEPAMSEGEGELEPAPSADAVAMSERVQRLERELASERAERAVVTLSQTRQIDATARKALVELHQRDQTAYELTAGLLPVRLSEQPRMAVSGGPSGETSRRERVHAIAESAGITLSEANRRLRAEEVRHG